jgi:hypothetical protein
MRLQDLYFFLILTAAPPPPHLNVLLSYTVYYLMVARIRQRVSKLLYLSMDSIRACTKCTVMLTFVSVLRLIFNRLKTCNSVNACRKTLLAIHFMYLGNKEI